MSEQLKFRNFHGWECLSAPGLAIGPHFSEVLSIRVRKQQACNIVVSGEPGVGKSYMAVTIARILEGITGGGSDRFKVRQVVFRFSEYMSLLPRLKMGKVIVFDEPSYAMGKREWFKELNKALVQTIESQRFLVHPLLIPIINQALLDKTIRSYLIQFRIHIVERGHAIVYRIKPSQHTEKVYHYTMCHLYYKQQDPELCTQESCLGCTKFDGCKVFRAQYERKKRDIQLNRYDQAREKARKTESKDIPQEQIILWVKEEKENLLNSRGRLDMHKMKYWLKKEREVILSTYKAYEIKKAIEFELGID